MSAGERIAEAVREIACTSFRPGLRSLVLTGSLARDEGTWVHENGRELLAGDAEFLAVFGDHTQLPSADAVAAAARAVEKRLHESGVEVHIGLSPVGPRYLRRLQPHIFAYELLKHGRVIWGDENILSLAPRFSRADIPLEDGFRLLVNRIIELLEAICTSQPGMSASSTFSGAVHYRAMKLWLDMATSFLLFQGQYQSTYRQRASALTEMALHSEADSNGSADTPIPFDRFAQRVSSATDYKLGITEGGAIIAEGAPLSCASWGSLHLRSLVEDAHSLWRWELRRLTGLNGSASDNELIKLWLKSQELAARIRGWAAAVKRYGLLRSAGMLPRWVRLGLKGSPRRLVYAAASELFFGLNPILSNNDLGLSEVEVRTGQSSHELPVVRKPQAGVSWQSVGRAVAWNYHQFLESTRS